VWARPTILVAALVSFASFPSAAAAQRCARDDVAALHQYCDQVPGAAGPASVESSSRTLRDSLRPSVRRRLERVGPEGTALLALSPGVVTDRRPVPERLPGAAQALIGSLADRAGRDRGEVARAVSAIAGSGLSGAFKWALLLSTLIVAGTAWLRHRAGAAQPASSSGTGTRLGLG
jgi:hypothetical protein